MIGSKFGRWTVLSDAGTNKTGHRKYRCRCDCGQERTVMKSGLLRGSSQSCGCLRNEFHSKRKKTHGLSKHRLFPTWDAMMQRCYNEACHAFADYGGRGVKVCERWHDVTLFVADNEHLALPGLTLDRKDNDGSYTPGNVRWATRTEQSLNRRSNVVVTYAGRSQTIFEWARELNMPPRTLWSRLRVNDWSVADALTTPVNKTNRRASIMTYNGRTDTIFNLARQAGLNPVVVTSRIRKWGWSVDKALSTPIAIRSPRKR